MPTRTVALTEFDQRLRRCPECVEQDPSILRQRICRVLSDRGWRRNVRRAVEQDELAQLDGISGEVRNAIDQNPRCTMRHFMTGSASRGIEPCPMGSSFVRSMLGNAAFSSSVGEHGHNVVALIPLARVCHRAASRSAWVAAARGAR